MSSDKPAVIIDNGSFSIKAGFACDNHPVAMFRTAVGRPNYLHGSYGKEPYDVFIGDEAFARAEDLEISLPVVNGRVVHWDNMERILHHILYKELKVAPEDRAIMLACACTTPLSEKLKFCEVIFETLNAPAFCVQPQGVLALYGSGSTTGISVDLGYATADICPVYEGGLLSYATMTNNLPSSAISVFIKEMLAERGIHVADEVPNDIRDNRVYITKNSAMSKKNYYEKYVLPSGEEINICNETFMSGELLFQPDLVAPERTDIMSLQGAIVTAALKCDPELRDDLYKAVVPCGGMSMIPGLGTRLQQDLEKMTQKTVNVMSSDEGYAVAWLGSYFRWHVRHAETVGVEEAIRRLRNENS
ncbi:actin-like isoform X1 [Choristoneura fumiferana]|uniref:actin-like isoform X1 n=1 Tax=Choristoneura fumiferana TaxID=7141 RepID=UPI003D15900F